MNLAILLKNHFGQELEPELLKINDYLHEENSILIEVLQQHGRIKLSDEQKRRLAEKGIELKPATRRGYVGVCQENTLLKWHRQLVRKIYDGTEGKKAKQGNNKETVSGKDSDKDSAKNEAISDELKILVLQLARENRSWGYDRIADALKNLGYEITDTSVGRILKEAGIPPAPTRGKGDNNWAQFLKTHAEVIWQADFATTHIWTLKGLVAMHILFFINLKTRQVGLTYI